MNYQSPGDRPHTPRAAAPHAHVPPKECRVIGDLIRGGVGHSHPHGRARARRIRYRWRSSQKALRAMSCGENPSSRKCLPSTRCQWKSEITAHPTDADSHGRVGTVTDRDEGGLPVAGAKSGIAQTRPSQPMLVPARLSRLTVCAPVATGVGVGAKGLWTAGRCWGTRQ